ncbi:uncharacterized protein [Arachis hypogaea]|uniref:uncharacterized protein n=1 Tax=Arachis hypogaea TaxID=3818 RepID=UPI003B22411A
MVKMLCKDFEEVTIRHVPRERNGSADLLSKLASTKPGAGNRSLIQGLVKEPSVILCAVCDTRNEPPLSWIDPNSPFLGRRPTPQEREGSNDDKKGGGQKFLRLDQADYVLSEVHEGCCGHHIEGKALARKLVRAGYYWSSMMSDAQEFVGNLGSCGLGQWDAVRGQEVWRVPFRARS